MDSENLLKIIQLRQERKVFPSGFISKLHRVEYPDFFSSKLINLIENLLLRDPEQRFGFTEVSTHEWLKEVDVQKCLAFNRASIPAWVRSGIAERKRKNFNGLSLDSNVDTKDLEEAVAPAYRNFDHLMEDLAIKDKNHAKLKWKDKLPTEDQQLFADWDYISPGAIKTELQVLSKNMGIESGV